jgi:hypothetical protein
LEETFELTNMSVRDLEHDFGPDGSGLPASCKQSYETDRAKNQAHKGYEKIVVMVGLKYKFISAFKYVRKFTDHDSSYFESLLAETVARYGRVDLVCGDFWFFVLG